MNAKTTKRMKSVVAIVGLLASVIIASQAQAVKTQPQSPVNINSASVEQLMELPGIGKSKAAAIVEYRTQAKFTSKEDLVNVKGIGEKLLAKISNYVTVSGSGKAKAKPGTAGKALR